MKAYSGRQRPLAGRLWKRGITTAFGETCKSSVSILSPGEKLPVLFGDGAIFSLITQPCCWYFSWSF